MAITSTEKKRRFILFSLLGLAAAVVIVLASFLLFTPEKPSGTSKMASARTEAVSGQAGGVGSEEYNQKLKEHDAQQANAALQSGASFIPTPIGEKSPLSSRSRIPLRRLRRLLRYAPCLFRRRARTTPCSKG